MKLCPECESPLIYPGRCGTTESPGCNWVWRADISDITNPPSVADEVKKDITLKAKLAAKEAFAGEGPQEGEPGYVDYWRKRALEAMKNFKQRTV